MQRETNRVKRKKKKRSFDRLLRNARLVPPPCLFIISRREEFSSLPRSRRSREFSSDRWRVDVVIQDSARRAENNLTTVTLSLNNSDNGYRSASLVRSRTDRFHFEVTRSSLVRRAATCDTTFARRTTRKSRDTWRETLPAITMTRVE